MKKKNCDYTNEELAEIAIVNSDFSSPAFQLYVNDFLGSNRVTMMDVVAVSGYFFLLLVSWNEKDCGLPTEDIRLVKLSRLYPEQWDKAKQSILENFFEYKDRYYNRRLLLERIKQINMRKQRTDALQSRYGSSTGSLRNESEMDTGKNIPEIEIEIEDSNSNSNSNSSGSGNKYSEFDMAQVNAFWIPRIEEFYPTVVIKVDEFADDIRKLREIDKLTEDQIRSIQDYISEDEFWIKNIGTPGKLRDRSKTREKEKYWSMIMRQIKNKKQDLSGRHIREDEYKGGDRL